jgi:arylsulfatase A-like enzyme
MVLAGPGLDRSAVVSELVSLVDLPPTLLAAAGLDMPETMHGRSLLGLIDRRAEDWPEEVFLQISEAEVGRAIRTDRWKYSVFAPDRDGKIDPDSGDGPYVERYLYDLHADPFEQVNLIGRAAYREIADDLMVRLKRRMVAAGEAEPTIVPARYYA